ncbi:MAG: alpha-amylase family glycosyl hydrolase [Bacteroidota bacterium]
MKKILTLLAMVAMVSAKAQLLIGSNGTAPFLSDSVLFWSITLDANYGNKALLAYTPTTDVYVHMGVITNKSTSSSDWKHVNTKWATVYPATGAVKADPSGTNKWALTISGTTMRNYFGITDPTEIILKVAILFRNGAGTTVQRNADGSDMYVNVYDTTNLHTRITVPMTQPMYNPLPETMTKAVGDALPITAWANKSSKMTIYYNGSQVARSSVNGYTLTANPTITVAGNQQIIVTDTFGTKISSDTFNFVVVAPNTVAALPAGTSDGINYEAGDTSVVMVLYAPNKSNCFIVGDFTNNYKQLAKYQMNKTPDGNRFWIRITGLTPGVEYGYQYLIDGTLKVADYNCEKVLDPWNDKYIYANTYPNLKPYPTAYTTGIVSVLQTAKPKYNWNIATFNRPDKRNLVIYELLVRDFLDTANANWQTLKDTLTYLKGLGINAIELMPFNEFDGNNSWGYNPSFYFAPDKAYGTELALKAFIDECHKNGIAVIQDLVMNHSWGSNPMVQMYFNSTAATPASNSPWFNVTPTHDFNVGYQFNHQSQATKDFVDRVINHWLTNYHVDGFRWDLSKGFTQTNTIGNISAWAAYDQGRVDTWKRIYDKMQSISPYSFCILEHFADNSEETVLANYGMMPWGNMSSQYEQCTMGWNSNWDLSGGIAANRGWNNPYLVTYAESHDQERLQYLNQTNGNSYNGYSAKNLATGLQRDAAAAAMLLMAPGPKMIWEFGELGFDTSLHHCSNGTTVAGSCNTDPKPPMWNYMQNANRKALHDVYAKLMKLRTSPNYKSTFTTGVIAGNYNLTGLVKQMKLYDANLSVVTFANFDVAQQTTGIGFPSNGTWYYYVGSTTNYNTINVSNYTYQFTLAPGEYYVFTSAPVNLVSNINVGGNIVAPGTTAFKSINGVTVSLNGSASTFSGNYNFSVLANSTNTIKAYKNNDVNKTNGVTTLDIALVQSHILSKAILSSPYKIIAADVNGDGKVSALDIVYMKRLILGIDTTFTNSTTKQNRLWAFADSSYTFAIPASPFPYRDSINADGLSISTTTKTIIGMKLGDVNWDWNNALLRANNNTTNAVVLTYDPIRASTGNLVRVPVKISNFKEMMGMQFTLSFNADALKWKGVSNNVLNIEMGTNHAEEGKVTFLWNDPNNDIRTLEDGSVIMELVFEKKGNCINEQLDINSSITTTEALDKDYQQIPVIMKPASINAGDITENWLVSPNPATNGVIKTQLQLKENKLILFRVIDITGKVVLEQRKECVRGNNQVTLQENKLLPTGTYYLQALGVEGTEVKKILVK